MEGKTFRGVLVGILLGATLVVALISGAIWDRAVGFDFLDRVFINSEGTVAVRNKTAAREIVDEETVVTRVVEEATPSVVTVSISKVQTYGGSPFDLFGQLFFNLPGQQVQGDQNPSEQDIGTGFVIDSEGLIITNKHVVSDTSAKYKVVIGKDEVVDVQNIYRDPASDLAILKVNKTGLTPVKLGDSSRLKVGQTVIAIGTALGEFRSTVTKGVISGLGRGITAGSPLQGSERLDDVIQTDAAINPGNSGGPLFNSSGEVIGVNVAVTQGAQNIGFALPINLAKEMISNFKSTGQFERPYLGVAYRMISQQAALLNEVPVGAYVQEVLTNSPAQKAGIKAGDIITEIDGQKLTDEGDTTLASIINKKKIGDEVGVKIWREQGEQTIKVKLEKRAE